MFKQLSLLSLILLLVINLCACKDEPMEPTDNTNNTDTTSNTAICNDTTYPIVMMHGFLASGDTYAKQFQRFSSNGYCDDRLYAFDWNSINGSNNDQLLDAFIDEVLANTGAEMVVLAGHSAGGGLGYNYLSDPVRAAKVHKYIHIGSNPESGPAGPNGEVPTMNIYSAGDEVVTGADIPGATNVMFSSFDHYQVATAAEVFEKIYEFIHGELPATTSITPKSDIEISGKVLTLGENQPKDGILVEVFSVDVNTGARLGADPDTTLIADSKGFWGPISVSPGQTLEFLVDDGNRPVHYYRESFTRSNPLVYLRTLPPPGSLAGLLFAGLPSDEDQSVVGIFSASQAVVTGRDELYFNGFELSTPQYASADQTSIAFFLYDDGDQQTSGDGVGLFGNFPFLTGTDVYTPANPDTTISITFNNRSLNIWNWKSGSEGVIVPVFD